VSDKQFNTGGEQLQMIFYIMHDAGDLILQIHTDDLDVFLSV
ncbi:MAG: hypothetical protein ACI9B8_002185, partial [Sulfitobacter sp.]